MQFLRQLNSQNFRSVTPPVIKGLPQLTKGQQVSPVSALRQPLLRRRKFLFLQPQPALQRPNADCHQRKCHSETGRENELESGDVLMRLLKMGLRAA